VDVRSRDFPFVSSKARERCRKHGETGVILSDGPLQQAAIGRLDECTDLRPTFWQIECRSYLACRKKSVHFIATMAASEGVVAAAAGLSAEDVNEERERLAEEASAAKSERIRQLLFGFKCRFYPKERPSEEELCMIKVRSCVCTAGQGGVVTLCGSGSPSGRDGSVCGLARVRRH
jgi:hypothetical protein